jgi:hypothetical protein
MTPTQKQIQERLHKMRDEEKEHIIMKLVAGLEFYSQIYVELIKNPDGYTCIGQPARQLLEELKGGVE